MNKLHVLLMCGGGGSEHAISLLSANFIEQQQLNIYELEELKLIDTFGDAYKHSPSQHQAIKLLTVIKSLKQVYLDKEDEESVNRILNELNSQNQVTAEKQEFKLIGAIRLTEMGFRDDGLSILIKIKESFADLLSEKDLDLLNIELTHYPKKA